MAERAANNPPGLFNNPHIMEVYQSLREEAAESGQVRGIVRAIEDAGPIMVVDPEEAYIDMDNTLARVKIASRLGMRAMIVGGSTESNDESAEVVPQIRKALEEVGGNTLLISFPSSAGQVQPDMDATLSLFMPQLDEVFRKVPQVVPMWQERYFGIIEKSKRLGMPIVPVPYILFGGEEPTSVEKETGVKGIDIRQGVDVGSIVDTISPWLRFNDLAMLERGSGPKVSVNLGPVAKEVYEMTGVHPIVSGGINTPELVGEIVDHIKTPFVFGTVAELTPPDQFEELYRGFKGVHSQGAEWLNKIPL